MNVLVVEDEPYRIEWFKLEIPPSWSLFITKDVDEAKALLETKEFDYLFLDHDLKIEHYCPEEFWHDEALKLEFLSKCEKTGYDVALWMEENKHRQTKAVIFIHSLNPDGVKRMSQALSDREHYYIPFPQLKTQLVFND